MTASNRHHGALEAAALKSPRPGSIVLRHLGGERGQRYYLFVPEAQSRPREIIVLVHGISRNAREHIVRFAGHAARSGSALVAPIFSHEFCPDYQRLGWTGTGRRADVILQAILREVVTNLGGTAGPIALFGHSGGAQFAHRYALAYPTQVKKLVLCAAGYYTLPDRSIRFPLGLDCSKLRHAGRLDLEGFLHIPTLVTVGSRDTRRDQSLRRSKKLDKLQGSSRVERARRWSEALRAAAIDHGISPQVEFSIVRGAGHRFVDAADRGLCEQAWDWFTATLPAQGDSVHMQDHREVVQ